MPHAWAERQLARRQLRLPPCHSSEARPIGRTLPGGSFQPITLHMLLKQGASDYTWLPRLGNFGLVLDLPRLLREQRNPFQCPSLFLLGLRPLVNHSSAEPDCAELWRVHGTRQSSRQPVRQLRPTGPYGGFAYLGRGPLLPLGLWQCSGCIS